MDFSRTNWLAVAACVVFGMAMGFLFYGYLFNDIWMAGNGIAVSGEGEAMKMTKNGADMPMSNTPMIFNTVCIAVYALLMDWLLRRQGVSTWMSGATTGAVIGLIGLLGVFTGNMFAGNPTSLSMVDGSYTFLMFTIFGAIIGGWQKKA